ncbi:MAG: hypothetical protein J3Q66DRAFT_384803 [Benniella sp.]|nr:MAG: hypothetical protein J3Q66DRAFT_384803 [Benniella sp.]
MYDPASQAFRSTSSEDIITIPTCHDPTTSQHVVRWKDIQQYFENAQGIMNGKAAVIFLTNNNLEDLIPLRIAHHPGVVLDVVVADNSLSSSSASQTLDSTSMSSLRITEVDDDNQTLAAGSSLRELFHCGLGPFHDTHSSQYVELQQESSQQNSHHPIHDHLLRLQEQHQLHNQWILQTKQLLEQRMDAIQQKMEEFQQAPQYSQQRAHYPERNAQQQMDEVKPPVQLSEYQTQQQWQQQADMILQQMQQCQRDTIYRQSLIHYRIQEHLGAPLGDLLVPRFFIVLPKNVSLSDGQRDSSSLTFRLHFLCEGISYSPIKDTKDGGGTKGMCDIHMTNHPGYDIKDPKTFFGKYGSYILATMYMIKHGAVGPGFVVPPLAHSKLVAKIGNKQECLVSVKKDIGRLIDIAISHLEDTPAIESEINTTSHWSLELPDQAELKSYLDNIKDEHFSGDLHRLIAQGRHCTWMCGEHQHAWVIRRLEDVVNTIGETYSEDSKKIAINCDTEDERLYDAMVEFCKAQTTDDPSLSADIGQLSLTASASQAGQEVSVTINRLRDLTVDGVTFIQKCNLTKLMVSHTPEDTDEDRLVDILDQCVGLKELHIRCKGERSYAVIHLIISRRETTIRDGRTSALHILKVTDERWDPFDLYRNCDEYDHLVATATFTKDSTVFDMDTHLKMQYKEPVVEGSPISNFMREYGWSISSLATSRQFTDHLAALLDDAIEKRGSRLTSLILAPFSLTILGLDAVDRVIKRSQNLALLWICCVMLDMASQPEKTLLLFGRYGEKMNRLTLASGSVEKWLLPFTQFLPTANSFPSLNVIHVSCSTKSQVPHEFVQWLVAVVPNRLQPLDSTPPEGSCTGTSQLTMKTCTILARLQTFMLYNVTLYPQDWEMLIKAFDLTMLQNLHVGGTNFSSKQLDLLLRRIAATDAHPISLKILNLGQSELLVGAYGPALRAKIQKVAPQLTIMGL